MYLLSNSDIVNFVLKTNSETGRKPYFNIYDIRSALIVGRKSYLGSAVILTFCSWFYSRMEDGGFLIFLFLVSITGMRRR